MGCLFGCFGFKDYIKRKWHRFSRSFSWKKREPGVPRNKYVSLGSYKEHEISSEKEDRENIKEKFDINDGIHQEIRQEVKFRKTCGAILDTHLEICKESDQHYMVSNACQQNIKWEQQLDESSHHLSNEPEASTLLEKKSNSCQFEEKLEETENPGVEKESGSGTLDVSPQTKNHIQAQVCESPYATPLNLVDGMLTPGTIHPPNPENFGTRVIRSQFVYAIPDDSQNMFKSEIVEDKDIENSRKMSHASQNQEASLLKPPIESNEEKFSFYSTDVEKPVAGTAVAHCDKEEQPQNMFKSDIVEDEDIENSQKMSCDSQNQEASLLKPPIKSNEEEFSFSFSSPNVEKPVAGTAAAHCDKEEQSQDSSKISYGNGIPNSTTKYKEDQKVCWHATPFESRLEKVLSDEKCHPQRHCNMDLEADIKKARDFEAGIKARDFIRANSQKLLEICAKMKHNQKLQQETTGKLLSSKRVARNDEASSQSSST